MPPVHGVCWNSISTEGVLPMRPFSLRWLVRGFRVLNLVIGVFVVEAAMKLTAVAPRYSRYFGDKWNLFDFTNKLFDHGLNLILTVVFNRARFHHFTFSIRRKCFYPKLDSCNITFISIKQVA